MSTPLIAMYRRHAPQRQLQEKMEEFITQGAAPADRMIRDLVACEHAYINTDHPAFIGGNRAIAQVMERRMAGDSVPASVEEEEGTAGALVPAVMHKAKSTGAQARVQL